MWFSLLAVLVFVLTVHADVDPSTIKTVHVVASNHLDVGFTDYIVNVVNEYWDQYFPAVAQLKTNFTKENVPFQYLTHGWLLSLYLECPPNTGLHCPSTNAKKQLVNGLIADKTLTFHAFPFNSQNELYDVSMFEFGLYLSTQYLPSLISNYTSVPYTPPIVLSQRDVPGITRSTIPLLLKYNVSAISIGCNGQSAPPSITSSKSDNSNLAEIFMWKDAESDQSILTMIHKGGYGGIEVRDTVMIQGYDEAIMFDWNSDNKGPKNSKQYYKDLDQIQTEFPNAKVIISTMDAFVNKLLLNPNIISTLPVITTEIDDTWQYGANADPKKLSKFRIATDLRRQYLDDNKVSLESAAFFNFSRFLLKNGEHTFGITHGKWNQSQDSWSNKQLDKAVKDKNKDIEENLNSWYEQRRFGIDYALNALALSTDINEINLLNDITNEYKYIDNIIEPDLNNDWVKVVNPNSMINITGYQIQFNTTTGALKRLNNMSSNVSYIMNNNDGDDAGTGFGLFYYTTRTEQDFNLWYTYQYGWFGPNSNCSHHKGYCKNGLQSNADPLHQNLLSNFINLYQNKQNQNVYLVEMDMGVNQNDLKTYYGAASKMYTKWNFTDLNNNQINIEFMLINKTFTRIPENLFVVFNGNINYNKCTVTKLGENINVNNILLNGTKHLHVIESNFKNGNVNCLFNNNALSVQGIDSGNIVFVPNITNNVDLYSSFPVPLNQSNNLKKGFAFMLFNNVWNTNYPYWMPFDVKDTNSTFRFNLILK